MNVARSIVALCLVLSACATNPLPPANGVRATFDRRAQVIQVIVSNAQPPHDAFLVTADGRRFPLVLTLLSSPHVRYNAPPSVGLGLGGFGEDIGGGLGFGVPLGGPRAAGVDDQYVASARFSAPPDYAQQWPGYHIEFSVGAQALQIPAPSPV